MNHPIILVKLYISNEMKLDQNIPENINILNLFNFIHIEYLYNEETRLNYRNTPRCHVSLYHIFGSVLITTYLKTRRQNKYCLEKNVFTQEHSQTHIEKS